MKAFINNICKIEKRENIHSVKQRISKKLLLRRQNFSNIKNRSGQDSATIINATFGRK